MTQKAMLEKLLAEVAQLRKDVEELKARPVTWPFPVTVPSLPPVNPYAPPFPFQPFVVSAKGNVVQ